MDTIKTGAEARSSLLVGVNKLANAIKGTLGPQARTVIIQNPMGMPVILNDGVTIARAITDPDPYVQMGIDLLKEVATEAQQRSGDGTTTATLIAQTLCNGSLSLMEDGVSPLDIRDGLKHYLEETQRFIRAQGIEYGSHGWTLEQVATIAANNDPELGKIISGAVEHVGIEGGVVIEKSPTSETYYIEKSGLEMPSGYAHSLMSNMPRNRCEYSDPMILTTTERIESFNVLVPALELAVKNNKPLVIFCPEYNNNMLQNLLVNVVQGKVSVCLVGVKGMAEQQQAWLEDISKLAGSHLYKTSIGETIYKLKEDGMGTCDSFHSSATTTSLTVKEMSDELENHIHMLISKMTSVQQAASSDWYAEMIQNRLNRLRAGICTIYVGGASEIEQTETKERVDDAVNACRLALESGVVIGGGATLHRASFNIEDDTMVGRLFKDALTKPLDTIVENAGKNILPRYGGLSDIEEGNTEYVCGKTGEYRCALEDGVLDPMQVVLNSLESAVSIAALVLMTDAAIIAPEQ